MGGLPPFLVGGVEVDYIHLYKDGKIIDGFYVEVDCEKEEVLEFFLKCDEGYECEDTKIVVDNLGVLISDDGVNYLDRLLNLGVVDDVGKVFYFKVMPGSVGKVDVSIKLTGKVKGV